MREPQHRAVDTDPIQDFGPASLAGEDAETSTDEGPGSVTRKEIDKDPAEGEERIRLAGKAPARSIAERLMERRKASDEG